MNAETVLLALGVSTVSGIVVSVCVWFCAKAYFGSYLDEKAKNLASKEDISEITSLVEGAKHHFSTALEDHRANNQLRMAALDKRLQAHQEAFALWRKLFSNLEEDEIRDIVRECSVWWNNNCLYLEPEAREAFSTAYFHAHLHGKHVRSKLTQLADGDIDKVFAAGDIILKAVQLPGLTPGERASTYESRRNDFISSTVSAASRES